MDDSAGKKADHCDELQKATDLYAKVKKITGKGHDVIVKKKKDGRLYVYEGNLRLAE